MPGSSTPCGLGKRARSVTVPVLSLTSHLGELDRAGVAVVAAVLELQADLRAAGADAACGERAAQREQLGARLLDVDIDRIEPLDHRERIGLVGGDQRALGRTASGRSGR